MNNIEDIIAQRDEEIQAVKDRYKPIIHRITIKNAQARRMQRRKNYRDFLKTEIERLIEEAQTLLPVDDQPSMRAVGWHSKGLIERTQIELPSVGKITEAQLFFRVPETP